MATKCCATGQYHFEQLHGVLVFVRVGRKHMFFAKCSACGRNYEMTAAQMRKAFNEQKKVQP